MNQLYGWALRLADANGYGGAKAIISLARRDASELVPVI
jgi:hypothetical protein